MPIMPDFRTHAMHVCHANTVYGDTEQILETLDIYLHFLICLKFKVAQVIISFFVILNL